MIITPRIIKDVGVLALLIGSLVVAGMEHIRANRAEVQAELRGRDAELCAAREGGTAAWDIIISEQERREGHEENTKKAEGVRP